MRTAVLRGREHVLLSSVSAIAEGRVAVALSRGGAPKPYPHKEPNEDVAGFAVGEAGVLVAVADGHGGTEAAETAIDRLLDTWAPRWTARDAADTAAAWDARVREAIADLNTAIVERGARDATDEARTTLAFAVVRRGEDALWYGAFGDSHVFHVGPVESVDLADPEERAPAFLGAPRETAASLAPRVVAGRERLGSTRGLAMVTDGFSEAGIGVDAPDIAVSECWGRAAEAAPDLRPLAFARAIVEEAIAAHRRQRAGDNVGVAVIWCDGDGSGLTGSAAT